MSRKRPHRKLNTDKDTDYLFQYFINEDHFNDQMRGQLDDIMEKKIEKHDHPNLDSRVLTDKKSSRFVTTSEEKELPSNDSDSASDSDKKADVEFDDNISEDGSESGSESQSSSQSSVKSPYGEKIEAKPKSERDRPRSDSKPRNTVNEKPIEPPPKHIETAEERRARAREAHCKLLDLVENKKIKLSRSYTMDDDPDEMEAEYEFQKERRNKANQVKLYKNILLNIICGIEFLNEKYDPFAFKLKDWSKTIAMDMDDYTEVIEEIYEKYKDKGGKMAPEIRLLFMIIMSGVTYHLSQALFGPSGMADAVKDNPNMLNKLLSGFMKGNNTEHEPAEAKEAPHDNKSILDALRKHKQNKQTDARSDIPISTDTTTETTTNNDALAHEREKRLLAEQRAQFENMLRKQNEMHTAQLEQLRNQQPINQAQTNAPAPIRQASTIPVMNYQPPVSTNQLLSDASKPPRFTTNPVLNNSYSINDNTKADYYKPLKKNNSLQTLSDELNMFGSEIKDNAGKSSKPAKQPSVKKPAKKNWDDLIETISESTDIDLDDIIETSSKKRQKPTTSARKPKTNSATRSVAKKRSDTGSDLISASKKNNVVIKL